MLKQTTKLLNLQSFQKICDRSLILGIESSCDDSGAAIIDPHRREILAESIVKQSMAKYGGVIPTLAMKGHSQGVPKSVNEVLTKVPIERLEAIAVTNRPGLKGSLIMGRNYAQYLCYKYKLPMIPIHHMEAHALTPRLTNSIQFPFMVLLISGGHCILAFAKDIKTFLVLGHTKDNAPGEVFDKAARFMALHDLDDFRDISGGEAIQRMGKNGNPESFPFSEPLGRYRDCMFSFSGYRTNLKTLTTKLQEKSQLDFQTKADISASLQYSIGTFLAKRILRGIEFANREELWNDKVPKTLAISGGVASNLKIREIIENACDIVNCEVVYPPVKYCTDNGVMIAWNGVEKWNENNPEDFVPWNKVFDVEVVPRISFGQDITHEVLAAHIPNTKLKNKC